MTNLTTIVGPWGRNPRPVGGNDVAPLIRKYMMRVRNEAERRDCTKKRHHYVPQSYLRAWSTDESHKRVRALFTRYGIDEPDAGISGLCVTKNLYRAKTADGEEHNQYEAMLAIIDNEAARVIRVLQRLRVGQELRNEDIASMFVVMAFQYNRTPQSIRLVDEYAKWITLRLGESPLEVRGGLVMTAVFEHIYHLASEFSGRQLELWNDPAGRFITSDQPIQAAANLDGTLPPPRASRYIWWPISPTRLVALSPTNPGGKVLIRNASRNLVRTVRSTYLRGAEATIVALPKDRDLPSGSMWPRPQIAIDCASNSSKSGCNFTATYEYGSSTRDRTCQPLCSIAEAARAKPVRRAR